MKRLHIALILLAVGFSMSLSFPSPVAAQVQSLSCAGSGNLYDVFDARQFFYPLTIEVDFQQTPNRGGDWTSNGLVAGRPRTGKTSIGSDYLTFEAFGNDTYTFWFQGGYTTNTMQFVNVTIIEGDRSAMKEEYCMNGTAFYLEWIDATVVYEPHPLSTTDVANAIYPELAQAMVQVATAISGFSGTIIFLSVSNVIQWFVMIFQSIQTRKLRKRLGG